MHKLVLLRHGESEWNLANRFTGWTDVDLSPKGIEEATAGAKLLKEGGYVFDVAHTSLLRRAIRTLWITLEGMDLMWIPVRSSWRLNERHYGALQGLNKAETAKKFGEDQVKIWRRAYATPPPPLTPDEPKSLPPDMSERSPPPLRPSSMVSCELKPCSTTSVEYFSTPSLSVHLRVCSAPSR